MAFYVFVEGATDATPAGMARLAEAIAKHYGLPAAELLARLQKGRFRVKGNIDREMAEKYVCDLERLGARCSIEEATAENSQRNTPIPFPAVRPATPPAGVLLAADVPSNAPPSGLAAAAPSRPSPSPSGLAAAAPSRPSSPPSGLAAAIPATPSTPSGLAAAPSRPSSPPSGLAAAIPATPSTPSGGTPQYQSGLAAAFSGDAQLASLGALEQANLPLSLASVDGADDSPASSAQAFAPPDAMVSASIGPPPDKPSAKKAERPKDVPVDLFAPPDAQGDELKVDIASDELEVSAKKRAATPVPATGEPVRPSSPQMARAQSQPAARKSQPSLPAQEAPVGGVAKPSKLGPLGDERVRFAAGVLLAILIGFVPAHLVAAARESSAYKTIDDKVMAAQQLADTPDTYATLDKLRADQLDRKKSEQRNAAIIAFAIWALAGGAVAFAWFKKVPWERFEG
jgi:hypothetical protein